MFRIATTRYPRRSSQLTVAVCSRPTILSLFRIENTQTFSQTQKCDEHVKNHEAPRRTALEKPKWKMSRPEISDSLSSCDSVEKVLHHLGKYPKVDIKQYQRVVETIHKLYKSGRTKLSAEEICRAEEFESLIKDVGNNGYSLNINSKVGILRVLTELGISSNNATCQTLLRSISKAVKGFNLKEILFLDTVLRKCVRSPIVNELQSTVRVVFETRVRSQLDTCDVPTIARALCFAFGHKYVSVETRGLLIDAGLHNVDQFHAKEIATMLWDFPLAKDNPENVNDLGTALMTRLCENVDQLCPIEMKRCIKRAIHILKELTVSGVSSNGAMCQSSLRLISERANILDLQAISFLDVTLRKCAQSPVVDKLQSILPVYFETQVRSKLDTCDVPTLARALCFAFGHKYVSVETRGLLIDAGLHNVNQFHAKEIADMLWDFPLAKDNPKNVNDLGTALMTRLCENVDQLCPTEMKRCIKKTIHILKVLTVSRVPSNGTMCQSSLRLISERANVLDLKTISFLDVTLRKCAQCPVVDKLQSTLPVYFETQVGSQLDTCDDATLASAVHFAFRCRSVSNETRGLLADAALDKVNQFNAKEISRILDSFTLAEDDPKNVHDLHNALMTRLRSLDQSDANDVGSNIPSLSVDEAITSLKVSIESGISSNSTSCQSLLQLISERGNELQLKGILFLNLLLSKCARSLVVDKLRSILPVYFETQVRSKLDTCDVPTLARALCFAFRHEYVSVETRGLLIDAGLHNVDRFHAKEVADMLWDFPLEKDNSEKVYDLGTALMTRLCENVDQLYPIEMKSCINRAIHILKALTVSGVSSNRTMCMSSLRLISEGANVLDLMAISILDVTLRKCAQCPVVDKLQSTLPVYFEMQVGSQLDTCDAATLARAVDFVFRHRSVSDETRGLLVDAALVKVNQFNAKDIAIMLNNFALAKDDPRNAHNLHSALKARLRSLDQSDPNDVGSNIPSLSVEEAMGSLKVSIESGISSNSTSCQSSLQLISEGANKLQLKGILFLNLLLSKCARSPIVEELRSTLPVYFETQVRNKLDTCDAATLARAVDFAFRHRSVSDETRGLLVDAALAKVNQFNAKEIAIMLSMFALAKDDPRNVHDLHNALMTRLRSLDQSDPNDVGSNTPSLIVEAAIGSLKVSIESGISSDSTSCQSSLQLISERANELQLKGILFLDALLKKCAQSPVVDKLRSILPVYFETEVRSKLDTCDVPTLARALCFAFGHKYVSVETRGLLIDAGLHNVNQFHAQEIADMLWDFPLAKDNPENVNDLGTALMTRLCENVDQLCPIEMKRCIKKTIHILKVLTVSGVSSNDTMCQSSLRLISERANILDLDGISFLDFTLRKCAQCPVVDELQSTIPVVFQARVRSELDTCDAATLARAVDFVFRHRSVSDETRGLLVDAALAKVNQFNAKEIAIMLNNFALAKDDPRNVHNLHSALKTRLRSLDQSDPNDVGSNIPSLSVDEAIGSLKVSIESGISSNSTCCQSSLQLISERGNELQLKGILFLDLLLKNCAQSPVVDKLQSILPVYFETQVGSELDTCDDATLANAVQFAFRHRSVSGETRGLLADAALDKVDQFNAKEIAGMLDDLRFAEDDPKNIHDLHTALMTRLSENSDQLNLRDHIVTLPCSVISNYLFVDQTRLNQEIIEKAIQTAIECDVFRAVETGTLLRNLNRISYYCPTLLDYVDKQLQQSADLQTFPRVLLFSYVISCADCCYKPRNWKKYEEKLVQFIEANIEGSYLWQIGNALLVLKCWSKTVVEYCFQDDHWRSDSEEELRFQADMMNLYQCVKLLYSNQYTGSYPSASNVERITKVLRADKEYPLLDSLKVGLGGLQYVLHGVNTKLGQIIDYLIVKCKNGELYPINTALSTDNSEILYESLRMPEDGFPIAIVLLKPSAYCLDGVRLRGRTRLQLRCLEVYGITPIPVSQYKWLQLSDIEKLLFLVNKIDACVPASKSKRKL